MKFEDDVAISPRSVTPLGLCSLPTLQRGAEPEDKIHIGIFRFDILPIRTSSIEWRSVDAVREDSKGAESKVRPARCAPVFTKFLGRAILLAVLLAIQACTSEQLDENFTQVALKTLEITKADVDAAIAMALTTHETEMKMAAGVQSAELTLDTLHKQDELDQLSGHIIPLGRRQQEALLRSQIHVLNGEIGRSLEEIPFVNTLGIAIFEQHMSAGATNLAKVIRTKTEREAAGALAAFGLQAEAVVRSPIIGNEGQWADCYSSLKAALDSRRWRADQDLKCCTASKK